MKGEVISTPYGEAFRVKDYFPSDFRYGAMTLTEILNIPTYPAHLLTKDERLKELDFQKALFLDTETTGLSGGTGTFAFMVGLGFVHRDGFSILQFFMRDYSEEKASLSLINQLLESFQFLATFNGKQYDIPLLETRFILCRMKTRIREMPNFELLYPSRKIWKGAYDNCRLATLESQLLWKVSCAWRCIVTNHTRPELSPSLTIIFHTLLWLPTDSQGTWWGDPPPFDRSQDFVVAWRHRKRSR